MYLHVGLLRATTSPRHLALAAAVVATQALRGGGALSRRRLPRPACRPDPRRRRYSSPVRAQCAPCPGCGLGIVVV